MATIESAATGLWSAGATWVGGVAPNAAVDSAVILNGHVVTLASTVSLLTNSSPVAVESGGTLTVSAAGTLNISGSGAIMDVLAGGTLNVAGRVEAKDGNQISTYGAVTILSGGILAKAGTSELTVNGGALDILSGAIVNVVGPGGLNLNGGIIYHRVGGLIAMSNAGWLDLTSGTFYQYGGDITFGTGTQFVLEPTAQIVFTRASKTMENAAGTQMIVAPKPAPKMLWEW